MELTFIDTQDTWLRRNEYKGNTYSTSECVKLAVNTASGYHDGELESLRSELEKLTEIVAQLVGLCPEDTQKAIIGEHLYGFNLVRGQGD